MRIRELERRIKAHTLSMVDRRRKPKGTPQEEMVLAQKELEVVSGDICLIYLYYLVVGGIVICAC